MPSPDNQYEALARDAAARIEASKDLQAQLSLLPDEAAEGDTPADGARRTRGQGKALNQMRDWLAARGYRMPEDVLAEMAGLASRESAILTAMAQAEQVLTWAGTGAANRVFQVGIGHVELPGPWKPTPDQRLNVFMQLYTIMLRAADALMPYGTPKASPDVQQTTITQLIVAGGSAPAQPVQVRDVTPQSRRIGPPMMPHEMQQFQHVAKVPVAASDGEGRT